MPRPNVEPSRPAAAFFDRVATAPISWGVCEVPGWGHQLPVERVLSEMADLGFTHTELGSAGWLPGTADRLASTLDEHGLTPLASFVPLILHEPAEADRALAQAEASAALLEAVGARYFNTAPVTSVDWQPRSPVDDDGWRHLYAMLDRLERLCTDHGLQQVVHEHVGCVVETRAEVDLLLANTATDLVLDTGHLAIGGYDPLEIASNHADRIGLVHLKDTDLGLARRLNDGDLSLMDAVQQGLFPPLGAGDLPLDTVVETLESAGYSGWYVIEQDCAIVEAPPPGAGPRTEVATSLAYLRRMVAALGATEPTTPAPGGP